MAHMVLLGAIFLSLSLSMYSRCLTLKQSSAAVRHIETRKKGTRENERTNRGQMCRQITRRIRKLALLVFNAIAWIGLLKQHYYSIEMYDVINIFYSILLRPCLVSIQIEYVLIDCNRISFQLYYEILWFSILHCIQVRFGFLHLLRLRLLSSLASIT